MVHCFPAVRVQDVLALMQNIIGVEVKQLKVVVRIDTNEMSRKRDVRWNEYWKLRKMLASWTSRVVIPGLPAV